MKTKSAQASLERWMQPIKRRRRRTNPTHAGSVTLGDLIARLDPGIGPRHPSAGPMTQSDWERLVGPRIADRSSPERLDPDGTLVVRVPTSVWAQELSMLSTTILERVASIGLKVARLRMVVGEPPQQLRPTADRCVRHRIAAPVPLPVSLRSSVNEIDDDALRKSIAAAAAASLAEAAADERRAKQQNAARPRSRRKP